MSAIQKFGMDGSAQGEVTIDDALLDVKRADQLVHDVVVAYRAAQRAGTASTLSKGEVAGSGVKPWRQKGTGRARAGYRQSPIWRGGAVAFGPKPRSYRKKINRKAGRLAFRSALAGKLRSGAVRVIEKLEMEEPKTNVIAGLLRAMEITGPVLLVLDNLDRNVCLSARNIDGLEITTADTVNTYQVVRYSVLLVQAEAMDRLAARMSDRAGASS